jgi:hypothetical protein
VIELGAGQLLDALSNLLPDDPMTETQDDYDRCSWCGAWDGKVRRWDEQSVVSHNDDCEWVAAADLLQRRDKDRHPTVTEANERQAP